jgi:glycosyltransferase involved in cell wall biosynthesis
MIRILHLSSDFQYQKLYPNLVRALSSEDIDQVVYLQKRDLDRYTVLDGINNVTVVQSFQYKNWMKFFFKWRVHSIVSDIEKSVEISQISMTVSYFLFSDGSVANEIFKKFNIPFVVAIRNSDINHYFKYRFWLKKYAKEVMSNASVITFPAPSYINIIKRIVGEKFFNEVIKDKIEIVGNIIDDRWFENVVSKSIPEDEIRLLYAGEFSKNKRIENIITSFNSFSKTNNSRLLLIGNYGDNVKYVNQLAASNANIQIIDKIDSVDELIAIFDNCHIFLMPSKTETFGNVYVEAMARGLPVVYTKGQGIDGYFPDGKVGLPVSEPLNSSILKSLDRIIRDYNTISINAIDSSKSFTKKSIVGKYLGIFRRVVRK